MCDSVRGENGEVESHTQPHPPIRPEDLMDIGSVTRLFKQCEDATDVVLKLLSESHVNLMEPRPDGFSILHSFTMFGCYDVIKLLWDKGARPTILLSDNSTLLHSAVCTQDDTQDKQRSKILQFLLSSGESLNNSMPVNHCNSHGWTALKLAARKNLEQCVEVLLGHEADPDIADGEMFTALHNAVGNPGILKMLATRSRRIDAKNKEGDTPLYLAVERGFAESALVLLEYRADPNILNEEGIAPLFLAARGGHCDLVRALLKNKAAVNLRGGKQQLAPLHWAAHKEREDIALLLIRSGADILLKDRMGRMPLSMAAPELASKMTKAALKVNPSLCLPSPTSTSPCMSAHEKAIAACCSGNIPALQVLHQSGVCVNYQCKQSSASLLHMAAYCGQLSVVMYLISRGADWKHRDKDGQTALHYAVMKELQQGQHDKTLEYLLTTPLSQLKNAQNSSGETPLNTASKYGFVNRVKILLQFRADPDLPNHVGELPIHRTCISDKNIEALMYLVELCPNINVSDNDGWTPLIYAAKSGSSAIVKYLIQRGADPNLTQSAGVSALYLAAQEESACICQVLLEAGADPNLSGGTQALSPLHIAAHKGSKKVCVLLVRYGGDIHQTDEDGDSPLALAETAELKQAILLAHSLKQSQRSTAAAAKTTTTTGTGTSTGTSTRSLGEGESGVRSEVADKAVEQLDTPDNDSRHGGLENGELENGELENGELENGELENGCMENNFSNGRSSRESYGIGGLNAQENGEWGNDCTAERLCQLQQQVDCYRKRLGEVEKEMESLCVDKELLMCRNRSLTAELHKRNSSSCPNGATTTDTGGNPSWLISNSSEYELTGPQLNTSSHRFYNIYHGTYRDIPVIVKKVRCLETWGPELYSLFQDEVMMVSQLQCPYLVQLLGARICHEERECALICEKMARGCLHLVLHVDKPRMECGQRLRILRDVCSGMAFIHSHQILHRNLLPRSILVGEHFNAKISDFGFFELKKKCNFYLELRQQCTEPQVYMAPEAMEKDEFTAAADVYSFGMVMWEIATGMVPFEEDRKQLSPVLLVMRLLMGHRPAFSPHHDQAYQRIAKSCWHSDPNLRPTFSTLLPQLRALRE